MGKTRAADFPVVHGAVFVTDIRLLVGGIGAVPEPWNSAFINYERRNR